jgi:hypothetical protein
MNRKELQSLVHWKSKQDRKPLIINGARQVGDLAGPQFGSLHFKIWPASA